MTMSEFEGLDRWDCLLRVAELLSEGKIVLEEPFLKETQEPFIVSDAVILDFMKKGRRSPRRKRVFAPSQESIATAGEKIRLRIIFHGNGLENIDPNVFSSQDSDSKKPSSKNPRKRRMNCEEEEGVAKKPAKKRIAAMDPALDLPQVFKNRVSEIGGDVESVGLVVQKVLTKTDVSTGHGRLSVHYSKVRSDFLRQSELSELEKEKGRVGAILLQPSLDEIDISLRNWKSNSEYALVHNWNKVCNSNGLKEGMKIQLWSFRRNSELCFALVQLS